MRPTLTLLSRPHCGLCEEFEAELLAELGDRVQLDVVDIDHYPVWVAEYGLSIPVLLGPQGQFVCAVQYCAEDVGLLLG